LLANKRRAMRFACSGPCPRFARRARSYRGMAGVGWRRSGSYPRNAPVVPVIADKVRSYGGEECRASRQSVGAGPARDFARREWCGWGGVGADLIRETRRWFRLSRTRSAPTGEECRASRQSVGAGPARDSRAGRAPTGEWCGWGGVADLIREARRWFRLSRTRSASTGGVPCLPAICRSNCLADCTEALFVGWVEPWRNPCCHGDGYRFAQPILRGSYLLGGR